MIAATAPPLRRLRHGSDYGKVKAINLEAAQGGG